MCSRMGISFERSVDLFKQKLIGSKNFGGESTYVKVISMNPRNNYPLSVNNEIVGLVEWNSNNVFFPIRFCNMQLGRGS